MRCASWARSEDVDPIGTAVAARGFLLVDWPQPWPRDASEVEALAPVHDALAGTGIRLQLVVPAADAATRSVVLHRRPPDADGWFAGFTRSTRAVDPGDVVAAATDLLASEGDDACELVDDADALDVLVCGHGSRDRCCGSMGTALALVAAAGTDIAVRRTSHTGGHRFAPTALVLPAGTAWAFLDDDALRRVVQRTGALDDLLPRYRGCAGLDGRGVQALERTAFAEVGWAWLDHRRRGYALDDGRVRLEAVAPDGAATAWEGTVEDGRRLPVPDCGQPIEAATKFETEVVLREVTRARR